MHKIYNYETNTIHAQAETLKGCNERNEDAISIGNKNNIHYAIVIDGATPLVPFSFKEKQTLPEIYVTLLTKGLTNILPQANKTLQECLTLTNTHTRKQLTHVLNNQTLTPEQEPSAGIALTRFNTNTNTLEVATLGDTPILIKYANQEPIILYDPSLEKLDNTAIKHLKENMNKGMTYQQAKQSIHNELIHNRLLKNKPNGYYILDPTGQGIPHLISRTITTNAPLEYVFLCTDGYKQLINMKLINNINELAQQTANNQGTKLLQELRKAEQNDKNCIIHPRFKESDDASYAIITTK